jgi:peptidoglycan/LPS O-acetylase OafA/YrhL
MAASTPAPDSPHVPVLDGIRGLAILLVMPAHFWGLAFGIAGQPPNNPLDRWLGHFFASGWIGVDLFFVLSGFLITGILLDARGGEHFFRSFYARRFLRIFPLYYGFLAVMLVIVPHIDVLARVAHIDNLRANQWWYWTYTMNIGAGLKDVNFTDAGAHSHFWSLAVEEQFYLVWPAVVLLLRPQRLAAFCVALVVACLALRVFLASSAADGWAAPNSAHVLMPARMDTFALGALLAIAARPGDALRDIARYAPWVAAGALAVVVTLFVRDEGLLIIGYAPGGVGTPKTDMQTVGFTALAFLFAALLAMTVAAPPGSALQRIFSLSPLRWMGRYAYGLYVVHVLVAFFLADRTLKIDALHHVFLRDVGGSRAPANFAAMLTGIAISCAIACASWHLYESQVLKLKKYVPYGRRRAAEPRPQEPPVAAPEQPRLSLL